MYPQPHSTTQPHLQQANFHPPQKQAQNLANQYRLHTEHSQSQHSQVSQSYQGEIQFSQMTDNHEEDLLAQDVHNRPHQPPVPQQYYSN